MEITILGSSAAGIPQIDCQKCKACRAAMKGGKNKKTMSAILIKNGKYYTLIDADPDLREQMIREKISLEKVKEIFLTHAHGDHIFGLFQLSVGKPRRVKVYGNKDTLNYIFSKPFEYLVRFGFAVPVPIKHKIKVRNLTFTTFELDHTPKEIGPTIGYRITDGKKVFTYVYDTATINKRTIEKMKGSDLLIFDGVFLKRSAFKHIAMRKSMPVLKQLGIKKIYYSQLNHSEPPHEEVEKELKKFGFRLAYDGLKIKL